MAGPNEEAGLGNGNNPENGNQPQGNSPQGGQTPFVQLDPNAQTQAPRFQIDSRYQHLPPEEAIARTVQSTVTPLNMKIKDLETENEKYKGYLSTIEMIMDPNNKDARLAFIRELEPDLIQPMDIDDQVKKTLDKEFGADFQPDQEEAKNNHWSKSAKYFRKMDRLYKEAEDNSKNNGTSKTFAELKKEIADKRKNRIKASNEEIKSLREKHKINDSTFNIFSEWVKGLKTEDYWNLFASTQKFEQPNPSFTGFTPVGTNPNEMNQRFDDLFGPDRSP